MSVQTFHSFLRLPPEIRRHIYLLATQPRFVHVQEDPVPDHDALRDFSESLSQTLPLELKLHPTLTYFAHNWCDYVNQYNRQIRREDWRFQIRSPQASRQTTLDAYGFTTTKQPYQPWPPSAAVPEVPFHWLAEHPELAWEFTRESSLYSHATIPALLQTCAESRQVLVEHGYELAFGTSTSPEPRTWFCFRDDVLYLERRVAHWHLAARSLLGEMSWNIGRFLPVDLQRVRRLALPQMVYEAGEAATAVRLFGGLKELFAVECNLDQTSEEVWTEHCTSCKASEESKKGTVDSDSSRETGLWEWVQCDESDALDEHLRSVMYLDSTGENNWRLKQYKTLHGGDSTGFFEDAALKIEKDMGNRRDHVVRQGGVTPWEIPPVKLVHVGSRKMIRLLVDKRNRYWWDLELKERREQERGVSPQSRMYRPGPKGPLSPFSQAWKDDQEAFDQENDNYDCQ